MEKNQKTLAVIEYLFAKLDLMIEDGEHSDRCTLNAMNKDPNIFGVTSVQEGIVVRDRLKTELQSNCNFLNIIRDQLSDIEEQVNKLAGKRVQVFAPEVE